MACFNKSHFWTKSNLRPAVGQLCDCGLSTWETRESYLEKRVLELEKENAELKNQNLQENMRRLEIEAKYMEKL